MLGLAITVLFLLCLVGVEAKEFDEFCKLAERTQDCPAVGLKTKFDDYRPDISIGTEYGGTCTCPITKAVYGISAESCSSLSLSCEAGTVSDCVLMATAPADSEGIPLHSGVGKKVTCLKGKEFSDKEARCRWNSNACTPNPDYTFPTDWSQNLNSCAQGNCFDRVWASNLGSKCSKYAASQYCTSDGKEGPGWPRGVEFEDYADSHGIDALKACCTCGGGLPCPALEESKAVYEANEGGDGANGCTGDKLGSALSHEQCKAAAVRLNYALDQIEPRRSQTDPTGCFGRCQAGVCTAFFNKNKGTGREGRIPICLVSENVADYCPSSCDNIDMQTKCVPANKRCQPCEDCKNADGGTGGGEDADGDTDKSNAGDSPGSDASPAWIWALVVIIILIILGVAGFLVYWFVFKKRGKSDGAKPKPKPTYQDLEMTTAKSDPSTDLYVDTLPKNRENRGRTVSKPHLVSVNGADVPGGGQSESDDTIDEEDDYKDEEAQKGGREEDDYNGRLPDLPTQPKPPIPTSPFLTSPKSPGTKANPPAPKPTSSAPKTSDELLDYDYYESPAPKPVPPAQKSNAPAPKPAPPAPKPQPPAPKPAPPAPKPAPPAPMNDGDDYDG